MGMLQKTGLFCLCVFLTSTVMASSYREYCAELYPEDSYEPDERAQYLQECYEQYADETETEEDSAEFYDGTVEDFVDEMAPEEQPQD